MPKQSHDLDRLRDILDAIHNIQWTNEGQTWETFKDHLQNQQTILHDLLHISDDLKQISSDFKSRYPQIPWSELASIDDQITNPNRQLNLENAWRFSQNTLLSAELSIESVLSQNSSR
jgi:uncharacterized protein with HEPN domain